MDSGGSSPLFYSGKVMVRVQTRSKRAALWDTTSRPRSRLAASRRRKSHIWALGDQIQHGGALIAEEELHRGMEGAGQAEPLELAARKFPGVAGEPALPDVEGIQQALLRHAGFRQGLAQGQQGVHHRFGMLPHHLHRAGAGIGGEGLPIQEDFPFLGALVARQQAAQGGLAPAAGGPTGPGAPRSEGTG